MKHEKPQIFKDIGIQDAAERSKTVFCGLGKTEIGPASELNASTKLYL